MSCVFKHLKKINIFFVFFLSYYFISDAPAILDGQRNKKRRRRKINKKTISLHWNKKEKTNYHEHFLSVVSPF